MHRTILCLLASLGWSVTAIGADTEKGAITSPAGHAHNDYEHDRPLLDALEHGFHSVEADVFLVDGDLLLGHHSSETRPGRSLLSHYIRPLAERIEGNGGRVHRDRETFHLLIDFKGTGDASYKVLQEQLKPYRSFLTEFTDTGKALRPITIILTGKSSVPKATIAAQRVRWVGCDGRVRDLDQQPNPHLIPWISDRWSKHFKWRGKGEMPEEERAKLEALTRKAHANGQTIRFWAAPDRPESWEVQYQVGVDWINTDKLQRFSEFISNREK